MTAGELKVLLQPIGKAEPVDEAEKAGDQPPAAQIGADDVLQSHEHDRGSNCRLDERRKPRALGSEVVGRAEQRERVGDGECGDDRQDLPQAAKRDYQAEQKEQMVEAAEDVRESQRDKSRSRQIQGRDKKKT